MKTSKHSSGKRSLQDMTLCALFAAMLCVLSPLSVPIGPVPVSLGLLGVLLCAVTLGIRRGGIAVLVFLLLGIFGIPVFSGGGCGPAVLAGPTGGYLWGYLPAVALAGIAASFPKATKTLCRSMSATLFCIVGTLLCYLCGTLQYCAVAGVPFSAALSVCVLPFFPFDLLKCLFAGILGVRFQRLIARIGQPSGQKKKPEN